MTINEDYNTAEVTCQNKRCTNKELPLDSSNKLTKSANLSVEDGVAPRFTVSSSTAKAATKPRPDPNAVNKCILQDLEKLSKSIRLADKETSVSAQKSQSAHAIPFPGEYSTSKETLDRSKIRENKATSLDVEQSQTGRTAHFSAGGISRKDTQAIRNLDTDPSPIAKDLPNPAKRLSDDDLMVVLEHCFDNFDFASISLNENSERNDLGDIITLKEIFSGDANDVNNDMKNVAKIFKDGNNTNTTGNRKHLKYYRLRKSRFLKHVIHVKPIRMRLERMLQESTYVERFLSKRKRKRKLNVKEDALTQSSAPVHTVSHVLSHDRPTKDKGLETRLETGNVGVGAGDRSGSKSKNIDDGNENLDDNFDLHQNDGRCVSKQSESGNDTADTNVVIPNQEGPGCSPLHESRCEVRSSTNSECRVRVDNVDGKEKREGVKSCMNEKGPLTTKALDFGFKKAKSVPTGDSISEESGEIYNGPVDLDETKKQDEFTALLRSPRDQHGHKVCSNHIAKRTSRNIDDSSEMSDRVNSRPRTARNDSINERREADSVNAKDDRTKKFNTTRNFWASLAVTNDQSIVDKNDLELNEERVSLVSDSESSGIGSFETAELYEGPFSFISETTEEKGARTKLTSVTVDDDSLRTCFSREVSLGCPSSEGEDSNLMESSISGIVKKKEITNRAQCIDYGRRTAIFLLVTIGLFVFGVFLGFMSNKKQWNVYKTDNEFEP